MRGGRQYGQQLAMGKARIQTTDDDDIFRERLYCIQWIRRRRRGKGDEYEFRSVTPEDLSRENEGRRVCCSSILRTGRPKVGCPTCESKPGAATRSGFEPDPHARVDALAPFVQPATTDVGWSGSKRLVTARRNSVFTQCLNTKRRLTRWSLGDGVGVRRREASFDNQALNTLFNYGCRGSRFSRCSIDSVIQEFSIRSGVKDDRAKRTGRSSRGSPTSLLQTPRTVTQLNTKRFWTSSLPGCARARRLSLPIGHGIVAEHSPSKARTTTSAEVWWPRTSA